MGERWARAYASLRELPMKPDLVDVFRAPQYVIPIVDDCIALGMQALWLQQGVVDEAAATRARAVGVDVVMDRRVFRDHMHFFGGVSLSSLSA